MGKEESTQTWKEKLLFYTTAFFILLGTFSLFAFLFLVPFVIDPAFTTIFMEFDETPAFCVTVDAETRQGASNCSWSSCREGCTKEVYDCTQIRVNYKRGEPLKTTITPLLTDDEETETATTTIYYDQMKSKRQSQYRKRAISNTFHYTYTDKNTRRMHLQLDNSKKNGRGSDNDDYVNNSDNINIDNDSDYNDDVLTSNEVNGHDLLDNDYGDRDGDGELEEIFGLQGNDSEWYYTRAKLYPNVKGCGYPPVLNCSIFLKTYKEIGTNFTCYYSKVDPGLVISELDMWQVYMNLVYAMAIPIPSFIVSVIYLTIAYFKIYNEDEETELLQENAEAIDVDGGTRLGSNGGSPVLMMSGGGGVVSSVSAIDVIEEIDTVDIVDGTPSASALTPGSEAFREDLASFGHQFKVAMADELSRESFTVQISNSISIPGNLCKTMTTSISTPGGAISEL